jgi:hypothetical protein
MQAVVALLTPEEKTAHRAAHGLVSLERGQTVAIDIEPGKRSADKGETMPRMPLPTTRTPRAAIFAKIATIAVITLQHELVISVGQSNGQAWLALRRSGNEPTKSGDAFERPNHAPITPDPWDDLQAAAIEAPEGENLMPVTPITSMSHELAAWWRMPGAVGTLIGGTL